MKKRLVGAVLVAMLLMTQVMGVCAGSATLGSVTVSGGGTASDITINSSTPAAVSSVVTTVTSSSTTTTEVKQVLNTVSGGASIVSQVENSYTNVTLSVVMAKEVTAPAGATVSFSGFGSAVEAILLHFNGSSWESYRRPVANGVATLTLPSWSPVVAIAVTGTPVSSNDNGYHCPNCGHIAWTEHNGGYRCYDCGYLTEGAVTAAVASAATATASPAGAVSPKTGVASDWAVWMTAAMMLMGASVIVLKKRA